MKQQLTILNLPIPVIDKIIFETWLHNRKVESILPFLYTCKTIYCNHQNILFNLSPLFLGANKKSKKQQKIISTLIESTLTGRISSIYIFPKTDVSKFQLFKNLRNVSLYGTSTEIMQFIKLLPFTTINLSITLTRCLKDFEIHADQIPNLSLKQLKFNSLKCLRRSKKHPFMKKICHHQNNTRDSSPNYYEVGTPANQISFLIATLVKSNFESLNDISIQFVSLHQIYHELRKLKFEFNKSEKMNIIKFDQSTFLPILHCEQWLNITNKLIYVSNLLSTNYVFFLEDNKIIEQEVTTKRA